MQKRGHKPPFFDIINTEIKFKIKKPTAVRKERQTNTVSI